MAKSSKKLIITNLHNSVVLADMKVTAIWQPFLLIFFPTSIELLKMLHQIPITSKRSPLKRYRILDGHVIPLTPIFTLRKFKILVSSTHEFENGRAHQICNRSVPDSPVTSPSLSPAPSWRSCFRTWVDYHASKWMLMTTTTTTLTETGSGPKSSSKKTKTRKRRLDYTTDKCSMDSSCASKLSTNRYDWNTTGKQTNHLPPTNIQNVNKQVWSVSNPRRHRQTNKQTNKKQ